MSNAEKIIVDNKTDLEAKKVAKDEEKKSQDLARKERRKELLTKFYTTQVTNPAPSLCEKLEISTLGDADSYSHFLHISKDDTMSVEKLVSIGQKVCEQLDILMLASVFFDRRNFISRISDDLTVIKGNHGVCHSKIYNKKKTVIENLEFKDLVVRDDDMDLFVWDKHNVEARNVLRLTLNIYCYYVRAIFDAVQSYDFEGETVEDDKKYLLKELIGTKLSVFKKFQEWTLKFNISGDNCVADIFKKKARTLIQSGDKVKKERATKKEIGKQLEQSMRAGASLFEGMVGVGLSEPVLQETATTETIVLGKLDV